MADHTIAQDLMLLVAGAALTSGVGWLITRWVANGDRITQQKIERERNYRTLGTSVQQDVLSQTSTIVAALVRARYAAVNKPPDEGRRFYQETFSPANQHWAEGIYLLRNRIAGVFGGEVAKGFYDRAGLQSSIDACGVLTRRDDKRRDRDCGARTKSELILLEGAITRWNDGAALTSVPPNLLVPGDFHNNLRVALNLLKRRIDCVTEPDPLTFGARCADQRALVRLLNMRVNVAGVMQERLADRLVEQLTTDGG